MKKIIFLVAALLAVFSGIAAVSAYEGHSIDVKAHVENAILVDNYEQNFGTVFPEASKQMDCWIGLSESFLGEGNTTWSAVTYKLYWEPKPSPFTTADGQTASSINPKNGYYIPIYPYVKLDIDGENQPAPSTNNSENITKNGLTAIYAGAGQMSSDSDKADNIHMVFTAPVFDKWHNLITDPLDSPELSFANGDYQIVTEHFSIPAKTGEGTVSLDAPCPQTDLGSILKVQVTGFIARQAPTNPN